MSQETIKNKHLKSTIEHVKMYTDDGELPPAELIMELVCELKVSNLIIAAMFEDDSLLFEHIESDEDCDEFIPLFTDLAEYEKHGCDDKLEPHVFDFEEYVGMVDDQDFAGIVIDVDGNFFVLEREFLNAIPLSKLTIPDDDVFGPEKLKEIFENPPNEDLVEFITDEDANDDIERLLAELSFSPLLNVVVSDEPLDEYAENGIIRAEDVGGFDLCCIDGDPVRLGALFTDRDAIKKAFGSDSELSYYGQVTQLPAFIEYILRNDMDGIVINPNGDDYLIMRDILLPQASGIEIIIENEKFSDCLNYAFVLDDNSSH